MIMLIVLPDFVIGPWVRPLQAGTAVGVMVAVGRIGVNVGVGVMLGIGVIVGVRLGVAVPIKTSCVWVSLLVSCVPSPL